MPRRPVSNAAASAIAAGALLAIAGCTSPGESPPPPAAASDRAGAPPITAPRDLTSRAADPCRTLLSPAQVQRLGYAPPGEFEVSITGNPLCTWRGDEDGRRVAVGVVTARDWDFFVETYRTRFLPVFRPLEIAGLPAVDLMSSPSALTCTTRVGVADRQSLDLTTTVRGGRDGRRDGDPCAEGHRVAEEIISTLPPA